MPNNPSSPLPGDLVLDVTALKDFLVDLPPGAMLGMRSEQDGFDEVVAEVTANQPVCGEQAGITATNFAQFNELNDQIKQIRTVLPAAKKLVEILVESEARADDKRQRLVSSFAQSVESQSKVGNAEGLLAKYEKTRAYRSAIADRAAKTRKKNAEAAKEAEAAKGSAAAGEAGPGASPK